MLSTGGAGTWAGSVAEASWRGKEEPTGTAVVLVGGEVSTVGSNPSHARPHRVGPSVKQDGGCKAPRGVMKTQEVATGSCPVHRERPVTTRE